MNKMIPIFVLLYRHAGYDEKSLESAPLKDGRPIRPGPPTMSQ